MVTKAAQGRKSVTLATDGVPIIVWARRELMLTQFLTGRRHVATEQCTMLGYSDQSCVKTGLTLATDGVPTNGHIFVTIVCARWELMLIQFLTGWRHVATEQCTMLGYSHQSCVKTGLTLATIGEHSI